MNMKTGQEHHLAVLTDDDVLTIRHEYATTTVTQQALADRYGVHQTLVGLIVRGDHWAHIGGPRTHRGKGWQPHHTVAPSTTRSPRSFARGEGHVASVLTEDEVVEMRTAYASGETTQEALAKRYRVTQPVVGLIVRGIGWAHVGGPRTNRGKGWQRP